MKWMAYYRDILRVKFYNGSKWLSNMVQDKLCSHMKIPLYEKELNKRETTEHWFTFIIDLNIGTATWQPRERDCVL